MPRQRLTRAESRERTRLRLLEAAAVIIARKGLAATSVEDIAAQAGYTRGAFYSNFSSKNELFIELLRADHASTQENLQKLLDAAPGEDPQKQLALLYAHCYRDNDHYVIWTEARLLAMRDATFRQRVNVLHVERRDMLVHFIERFCTCANVHLPGRCAKLALALATLMEGAGYFNPMPDRILRLKSVE